MKILRYSILLLVLFSVLPGCKKNGENSDRCDGILNENPPLKVMIVLADKQTGDNLILKEGLTATDLKITLEGTATPLTNLRIVNIPGSPLIGMLELAVFHAKAGEYRYKIETKGLSDVEFSYTIKQVKSDSPCKLYYYPLEGLKATNQDYTKLEIGDKIYSNGMKVLLK
ncbi:hypothetical protein [Pedobacter sp. V48]|uniref:hypothetical protein n=1 Tax=Pedobacter sp. V48 TaxID=509635 RepID=UPI0003E47442|nr:hypothetical protein [Pedobacter sp. V48]ETZ22333.1 hypothetical protein N824_25725 [Pedobacter sp. V48]